MTYAAGYACPNDTCEHPELFHEYVDGSRQRCTQTDCRCGHVPPKYRQLVHADELVVNDRIPGLGEIATVTNSLGTTAITIAGSPIPLRLASSHPVWVDRAEPP